MDIQSIFDDFVIDISNYPRIPEDQTLTDAVGILTSYKWTSNNNFLKYYCLLVVDDENRITGRINMEDILRAMEPKLPGKKKNSTFEGMKSDLPNLTIIWEDSFFKHCQKHAAIPVKSIMSPITIKVKLTDPVFKALHLMLAGGYRTLPVVDEGAVVGIVRMEELFTVICSHCEL
ncbi:MAG: CBS domain-containing protein [Thermodesulfobacteriota bacterium]